MNLTSLNFQNEKELPTKYTCDGDSIVPNLSWSGFPTNTQSFALIFEDPDAVEKKNFIHWLIVNIPATVNSIAEGTIDITTGEAISNDGGETSFIPPRPPTGTGIHHYTFKIFALDVERIEGITKDNFYEKIKSHVIDRAELMGKFQR